MRSLTQCEHWIVFSDPQFVGSVWIALVGECSHRLPNRFVLSASQIADDENHVANYSSVFREGSTLKV